MRDSRQYGTESLKAIWLEKILISLIVRKIYEIHNIMTAFSWNVFLSILEYFLRMTGEYIFRIGIKENP